MTYGLSHWLPYHGLGSVAAATYAFRSGLGFTQSYVPALDTPHPPAYWDEWRHAIRQLTAEQLHDRPSSSFRHVFTSDFYALSPYADGASKATSLAYQFHDPEHGVGAVLVYRREEVATENITTWPLRGLAPNDTYRFTTWDGPGGAAPRLLEASGYDLLTANFECVVPSLPGAAVFMYVAI